MVNSILVFVASWGLFASIMGVPLGYFNNDYRRDYLHPGFDGVDPYNHEFDYRNFRGYPVHLGNGRFYFLGTFGGVCRGDYQQSFYHADRQDSYIVCDHGRAHRFACPQGTRNRDFSHLRYDRPYVIPELCGVNLNDRRMH